MAKWCVYIMANKPQGVIYIGVTDDLNARTLEHKHKVYRQSFTARYNCDKLVYFEEFDNGTKAAEREQRMKKWKREWKLNLIKDMNPNWIDIALNWSSGVSSVYKTTRFLPTKE